MNATTRLATFAMAFVASAPLLAGGSAEIGKVKAEVCAGCHGADGNSLTPSFPKLAGQHEDYLLHAMHSYRDGRRSNATMASQLANLSDQDMEDLAAYFSKQHSLGLAQK